MLLYTKEGRGCLPPKGLCTGASGCLSQQEQGGLFWRYTHVAGILQKAAGESQLCPRPQPFTAPFVQTPESRARRWRVGGVGVWRNLRASQELHLSAELRGREI